MHLPTSFFYCQKFLSSKTFGFPRVVGNLSIFFFPNQNELLNPSMLVVFLVSHFSSGSLGLCVISGVGLLLGFGEGALAGIGLFKLCSSIKMNAAKGRGSWVFWSAAGIGLFKSSSVVSLF